MSDTGILQQFNINELAGATGLILGALGGILAIIFKSRCYCRLNLCYLCYCERKPPPDKKTGDSSDDDEEKSKKKPLEKQIEEDKDKLKENVEVEKTKEIIKNKRSPSLVVIESEEEELIPSP